MRPQNRLHKLVPAVLGLALAVPSPALMAHGDGHSSKPKTSAQAEPTEFGTAADPKRAARVMRIEMADSMRFTPSEIRIKRGESVKFEVANKGKVMHEMVLGTIEGLKRHAELMKKHPGMEHDEPYMAHVPPGKSGSIAWRFDKAGTFHYGCLVPGHFEAGMVGTIIVQ